MLSGDSHATWVSDLRRDNESAYEPTTGAGGLGVEFAGSAVSSPSSYGYGPTWTTERYNGVAANLTAASPSLQYAEGQLRGYFEVNLFVAAAFEYITDTTISSLSSPLKTPLRSSMASLTRPTAMKKPSCSAPSALRKAQTGSVGPSTVALCPITVLSERERGPVETRRTREAIQED